MSNTRIPALDGVRGLATITVLVSHFWFADVFGERWWWPIAHGGWMGVDLFFVLSGFLITGILLHRKGKPRYFAEFYRRRVLRIFPLYYFSLILSVVAILLIDQRPDRLWSGYDSLSWFFAFVPNFAMAFKNDWLWQTNWVGLNHLWSLAVEEQFYIVWPLVVWLLPRRALIAMCIVLLAAGGFIRIGVDDTWGMKWTIASYVLPYCHMDGLAAGSLLAMLMQAGWIPKTESVRAIVRDLTFAAGMVTFYFLVAENTQWRGLFIGLLFMGFVWLSLFENGAVRRICENRLLMHFGTYSYGMYVFHQMFRMVFEAVFRAKFLSWGIPVMGAQILHIVCAFTVTYLLARLSFKWIETPFLNMK